MMVGGRSLTCFLATINPGEQALRVEGLCRGTRLRGASLVCMAARSWDWPGWCGPHGVGQGGLRRGSYETGRYTFSVSG
jgi:hypothetical protein